jgi:hypothetical protein
MRRIGASSSRPWNIILMYSSPGAPVKETAGLRDLCYSMSMCLHEQESKLQRQIIHKMAIPAEDRQGLAFQGDSGVLNPMRYLPTPGHTKFWQERTPLAQYINNEVVGTRMRRWQRPIHDFVMPYLRGVGTRLTGDDGEIVIPQEVQRRRDLNTLADQMTYLGLSILPDPKHLTRAPGRAIHNPGPHPLPRPGCLYISLYG